MGRRTWWQPGGLGYSGWMWTSHKPGRRYAPWRSITSCRPRSGGTAGSPSGVTETIRPSSTVTVIPARTAGLQSMRLQLARTTNVSLMPLCFASPRTNSDILTVVTQSLYRHYNSRLVDPVLRLYHDQAYLSRPAQRQQSPVPVRWRRKHCRMPRTRSGEQGAGRVDILLDVGINR